MKTRTVLNVLLVMIAGTVASMQPASADHMCSVAAAALADQSDEAQELVDCLQETINETIGQGLQPIGNSLRIKTTAPERVWISDRYEITVFLANQDPAPHVVSLDVIPRTSNICSLASYSTSSSATQTRPNEYVLEANGTLAILGLFGGDAITGGAIVKPAAPGNCEMAVLVTMDALFQETAVLATNVDVPPAYADLGNVLVTASDCAGADASRGSKPTSLNVAANIAIDIVAALDYAEPCSDDNASGSAVIQKKKPDGTWETIGGAALSAAGHQDFRSSSKLTLPEGTHDFRVLASATSGFTPSWSCAASFLGAAAGLEAFGILGTTAMELFLGLSLSNPITAIAVALAVVIAIIIFIGLTCFGLNDSIELPFTVTAKSSEPCAARAAMQTVGQLVEDLAGCTVATPLSGTTGAANQTVHELGL